MNKKIFLLVALTALSSVAFAAGEFDGITDVISSADTAGRKSFGSVLTWVFAVILPLGCIIAGCIGGYFFAKKKAEQQGEGSTKIPLVVGGMAILGLFVYLLVAALLGQALVNDPTYIITKVIPEFYRSSLGV